MSDTLIKKFTIKEQAIYSVGWFMFLVGLYFWYIPTYLPKNAKGGPYTEVVADFNSIISDNTLWFILGFVVTSYILGYGTCQALHFIRKIGELESIN